MPRIEVRAGQTKVGLRRWRPMIVSLDSVTWLPVGPSAIGVGVTRWLSAEGPAVAVPALDNGSDAEVYSELLTVYQDARRV
jgi:hypothetical protein